MSEQVQAILDRMVLPLKDLLDKGVFNETEIKLIVARRRESEYLLRRRQARSSDYVIYIEAEKNLDKLRALRHKKLIAKRIAEEKELKENGENVPGKSRSGSSIGDASIIQHIHLLYARAKRKWKEDLTWHVQHAEFAKESKSHSMLSKIYAEALQIHPRNASLWIEAASHEYFGYAANEKDAELAGGGSIKNARVLLHRGLRVNPNSAELWLQSFCLELHYIQKLRGRRNLLQLGSEHSLGDVEQSNNNDTDNDNDNDATEQFYNEAKLPRIIYRNATKSISSDVNFRLQFVHQCRLFPDTQKIIDEIMVSIKEDFGNVEEAWIAMARLSLENKSNMSVAFLKPSRTTELSKKRKHAAIIDQQYITPLHILEEATNSVKTPTMFEKTVIFARSYICELVDSLDQKSLSDVGKRQIAAVNIFLKRTIQKAEENQIMSPELAVECANALVAMGLASDALRLIKKATENEKSCRGNSQIWLKRAEIAAKVSPNLTSSCKVLRKSLQIVPLHDEGHRDLLSKLFMYLLAMSSTKSSPVIEEEIESIYDKILLLHQAESAKAPTNTTPSLSLAYLQFASSKCNLELTRKIYSKLLYASNYTKSSNKTEDELFQMETLFNHCIATERAAFKSGTSGKSKQKLKCLCDSAFIFFVKNTKAETADAFERMKARIGIC